MLWQIAREYETKEVNLAMINLVTQGVLLGKPKALAVQAWLTSLWSLYHTKRADDTSNMNFNSVGNCPHSTLELMRELGLVP